MPITGIQAVGGKVHQDKMTSLLSQKDYAIAKALVWMNMLKEKWIPDKWYKPSKKGTNISFNIAQSQAEWDESFANLKGYVDRINKEHDLELEITGGD